MTHGAQASHLPGGRLHLHHGPIDLIIGVEGPKRETCYAAAVERFRSVLTGLVAELPDLRRPLTPETKFDDPIARRMQRAIEPYAERFVTPMAAVAGAVADEILAAMLGHSHPTKAYVNNGGDIALHLTGSAEMSVASLAGEIRLRAQDQARGIATSGWRGRSHSLGIADGVTVLSQNAASADAAATLIANSVDLPGHAAVTRQPATHLNPDSDLGDMRVTTHVASLSLSDKREALRNGALCAQDLLDQRLILSAAMTVQGVTETLDASTSIGVFANA